MVWVYWLCGVWVSLVGCCVSGYVGLLMMVVDDVSLVFRFPWLVAV